MHINITVNTNGALLIMTMMMMMLWFVVVVGNWVFCGWEYCVPRGLAMDPSLEVVAIDESEPDPFDEGRQMSMYSDSGSSSITSKLVFAG